MAATTPSRAELISKTAQLLSAQLDSCIKEEVVSEEDARALLLLSQIYTTIVYTEAPSAGPPS